MKARRRVSRALARLGCHHQVPDAEVMKRPAEGPRADAQAQGDAGQAHQLLVRLTSPVPLAGHIG